MKTNPMIINNNLSNNVPPTNNNQINNINANNTINNPNINSTDHRDAYITNNNNLSENNINYEIPKNAKYSSKTAKEKTETYYTDQKTGNKINIDINDISENDKYENKTYTGEVYLGETMFNNDNVTNFNNIPNNEVDTLSPILENLDINATALIDPHMNTQVNMEKNKLTASSLSVSILSDIPYQAYPEAKHSNESSENFAGFGVNSYNGKVKKKNEDRIKVVAHQIVQSRKDPNKKFNVSYFSIFDGHSGKKCSDFLKKRFFEFLMSSSFFPDEPLRAIKESFQKAESHFFKKAYDPINNILLDKSGSCALIMLIINNILYSINLGDSRALYSYDSGKCLLQITRDHKPNDEIEKKRIEKAGGKVYYANTITRNGKEIELKEEDFGEGFTFPYRISPGKIAVSRTIGDYYCKLPELGGVKNTVSAEPCINILKVDEKSDFLLMGCDGIFDRLDNDRIFKKIWEYKKQGKVINDIHTLCGQIADAIIKYSMEKDSVDNVSVVFIAFKNFEKLMKEPDYVHNLNNKCKEIKKDKIDFSFMKFKE